MFQKNVELTEGVYEYNFLTLTAIKYYSGIQKNYFSS